MPHGPEHWNAHNGDHTCGQPVRGGGTCQLDSGHTGYHSASTFGCDGCGKTYRGTPHATGPDGEYPTGLQFCFLCSLPPRRRYEDD